MEYKNIIINDKDELLELIKYSPETNYVNAIARINPSLAETFENCGKQKNEQHQCYMIRHNDYCHGAIEILNTERLLITIEFDRFCNDNEKLVYLNKILHYIKEQYPDKIIEVSILNDLDLEQKDSICFKKNEVSNNYIYSEEQYNKIVNSLEEEMNITEQLLTKLGLSWYQRPLLINFLDSYVEHGHNIVEDFNRGLISLEDIFREVKTIAWTNIETKKSSRTIEFNRTGEITYNKTSNKYDSNLTYTINYNITNEDFNLESRDIKISKKQKEYMLESDGVVISESSDSTYKRITYKSPIINNSSIHIDLFIDGENRIQKYYIDFNNHSNNNKIKGKYSLKMHPIQSSLFYINRKATEKHGDYLCLFAITAGCEYLDSLLTVPITFNQLDALIKEIIPALNEISKENNIPEIPLEFQNVISKITNAKNEAMNYLKQIKGDIPLPHLCDNIDEFTLDYDNEQPEKPQKLVKKHN